MVEIVTSRGKEFLGKIQGEDGKLHSAYLDERLNLIYTDLETTQTVKLPPEEEKTEILMSDSEKNFLEREDKFKEFIGTTQTFNDTGDKFVIREVYFDRDKDTTMFEIALADRTILKLTLDAFAARGIR